MPIKIEQNQEPITWSLQLPCVFVTAFSQTSLFLVLIYRELPYPRKHIDQSRLAPGKFLTLLANISKEKQQRDVV